MNWCASGLSGRPDAFNEANKASGDFADEAMILCKREGYYCAQCDELTGSKHIVDNTPIREAE